MDRRNGGDPLVPPPRPPKSLPRVHRPRAPEPLMMNANLPQLSPKPNHLSSSSSSINNNNNHNSSSSGSSSSASVTASGSSSSQQQSQLLGIINNNNNSSSGGVDTVGTPSLRHQFPPPLPPAPVSRSPQVNRSTKPNNNNINNNSSNVNSISSSISGSSSSSSSSTSNNNNIISPVVVPAPSSTTPTTFARRRPTNLAPVLPLITSTVPTLSSSIQQFDPIPSSPVTLAQPRPENERLGNEYVDTPFTRSAAHGRHSSHSHSQLNSSSIVNNNSHGGLNTISTIPVPELSSSLLRPSTLPSVVGSGTTAITKQPVATFTKDSSTTALTDEVDFHQGNHAFNSITCPHCGRCRCENCQRLRPLPSKWMFGDCCYISAESVIDYMSCLCCVKALYYHCSKDHEFEHDSDTSTCADDPCSCAPHRFASRWGCMAALTPVLPCLLCYWPMRGCAAICSKCYATHARHGCRCPPGSVSTPTSLSQPSKSGRSISNLLNRNQSTATTTTTTTTNNSHAPSSHQLNDRLLGSTTPDY